MFSILVGLYLGIKFLDHILTVFNFLRLSAVSLKAIPFCNPTSKVWGYNFFTLSSKSLIVFFFIIYILESIKWYLITLICISPVTNDFEELCVCQLATCVFSLERWPDLWPFFNGLKSNLRLFLWVVSWLPTQSIYLVKVCHTCYRSVHVAYFFLSWFW